MTFMLSLSYAGMQTDQREEVAPGHAAVHHHCCGVGSIG